MHPAMFLRGSQARFTDPDSGEIVKPGSVAHTFSNMIMAAIGAGFAIESIQEYAPDASLRRRISAGAKVRGLANGHRDRNGS